MQLSLSAPMFLCEVKPSLFFEGYKVDAAGKLLLDKQPDMTIYPCWAKHLTYTQADFVCGVLRKQGFRHAVVTDIAGEPVDALMLHEATE